MARGSNPLGFLALFILGAILLAALSWLINLIRKSRDYDSVKKQLYDALKRESDLKEDYRKKHIALAEYEAKLSKKEENLERQAIEIHRIANEKTVGFPWLSEAYSDYFHLQDLHIAKQLELKSHPAFKASEQVRDAAARRRVAEKLLRIYKYQISYYEDLFPWLTEFKDEEIDDLIIQIATDKGAKKGNTDDPAKMWVTSAEYEKLSTQDKYQLALNRYSSAKKSRWDIGRDYERFIGYKYECSGGKVFYQGIIKGFEDLGRDLIVAFPNSKVTIVQCKCWSKVKTIHEKHVFQLYGTVLGYRLENPSKTVDGILITSTCLSDTARRYSELLGIKAVENYPLEDYPRIKCNVSPRGLIYHLPFDQQYDRTEITERFERYAWTVKEAEELGFRRAMRWRGQSNE